MLFFGSFHVVADGHNRLSTQNWWRASRRLATCQQLMDPHLLGIHTSTMLAYHLQPMLLPTLPYLHHTKMPGKTQFATHNPRQSHNIYRELMSAHYHSC
jgi:hypothetical protein